MIIDNCINNLYFKKSDRAISAFNIWKSLMQVQVLSKIMILIKKNKVR